MASCENCYKAFEAGYEESEKAYIGTIEGLRARVAELEAALEKAYWSETLRCVKTCAEHDADRVATLQLITKTLGYHPARAAMEGQRD